MRIARLLAPLSIAALAANFVMPSNAQSERPSVERFTIEVPEPVLADLDERLARTRWPDQLPGTGWTYGADTAYLRELADYWQREYDWREHERALNRFEHYRATIDGTFSAMPANAVFNTVGLLRLTNGIVVPSAKRRLAPRPTPVTPIDRSRFSA